MSFPKNSAFDRQKPTGPLYAPPLPGQPATEIKTATVEVDLSQLESWYTALDSLARVLDSPGRVASVRNPESIEELGDVRDEIYSYLRG